MKKKLVKYGKILLAITLIGVLALPSYATVGASDGSAFVTKAEFDAALSDFNARLTTFEAGINSKIDSQVSSYLDRNGIWNGKEQLLTYGKEWWFHAGARWHNPDPTDIPPQAVPFSLEQRDAAEDGNVAPYKNRTYKLNDVNIAGKFRQYKSGIVGRQDYRYYWSVFKVGGNANTNYIFNECDGSAAKPKYFVIIENISKTGMLVLGYNYRIGLEIGTGLTPEEANFVGTAKDNSGGRFGTYGGYFNSAQCCGKIPISSGGVNNYTRFIRYANYRYTNQYLIKWSFTPLDGTTLTKKSPLFGDSKVDKLADQNKLLIPEQSIFFMNDETGTPTTTNIPVLPFEYWVPDGFSYRTTNMFVQKGDKLVVDFDMTVYDVEFYLNNWEDAIGYSCSAAFNFCEARVY